MPIPVNRLRLTNRIHQYMRYQYLVYLVVGNITYLSFSLVLIIQTLNILVNIDHTFPLSFIIKWLSDLLVKYLGIGTQRLSIILCLVAIVSAVAAICLKRKLFIYTKESNFKDLKLILNAQAKRRSVRVIYISAIMSILVFIFTFGFSPSLSENKDSIDNEIKSSLLTLKDAANQSKAADNLISLLKIYPISSNNYLYTLSVDTSMENDTKYISSELERVVFVSPSSPVLDRNLVGKIYDYKYSEGVTDNNTFWKYQPHDVIEENTRVYGSMQVSIPANRCAILSLGDTTHHEAPTMQRDGSRGDSVSAGYAMSKPECSDSKSNKTTTIYISQLLTSKTDDLNLKVYYIDFNWKYIDPKFYDRVAYYNNLDENINNDNFFDPGFKDAYLILDRSKVQTKTPPQFCIQGYNLGYKENIWSYKSNGDTLENKPCTAQ